MIKILRRLNLTPENEDSPSNVVAILNSKSLHHFILSKVTTELGHLSEDCYYPKVSEIYKELLYQCQTDEKKLLIFAKERYSKLTDKSKWYLLYDPYTILLLNIIQFFQQNKDHAAALSAFNLLSLRYYTNVMYKFIKHGCNNTYFRTAYEELSLNHIFKVKQTIGSSILFLSSEVYNKYKLDLETDNILNIVKMVYELRTRFTQSMKSFYIKYYESKSKESNVSQQTEEFSLDSEKSHDSNIKNISSQITRDITVYGNYDQNAVDSAQRFTYYNKVLAIEYAKQLNQPKYTDQLDLIIQIFLKDFNTTQDVNTISLMDHTKKLMSVKTSNKPIFYKKMIIELHDDITKNLGYQKQFEKLTVQSKATSRTFLALYITFVIGNHFIKPSVSPVVPLIAS